MLNLRSLVAVTVLAVPALLIACASSDPGPAPAGGKSALSSGGTSGAAQQKNTPSTPPAAAPAATPKPSSATCGAKTTEGDCYDCCFAGNPTAAAEKVADTCRTTAAQKCGSACVATIPNSDNAPAAGADVSGTGDYDPNAPDPCAACKTDIGACDAAYDKACAADANCAAATKCYTDSKCTDKGDDGALATTDDPSSDGDSSSQSSSGGGK